jgi:hypothetical protein
MLVFHGPEFIERQIAAELDRDADMVQGITTQLREGVVVKNGRPV